MFGGNGAGRGRGKVGRAGSREGAWSKVGVGCPPPPFLPQQRGPSRARARQALAPAGGGEGLVRMEGTQGGPRAHSHPRTSSHPNTHAAVPSAGVGPGPTDSNGFKWFCSDGSGCRRWQTVSRGRMIQMDFNRFERSMMLLAFCPRGVWLARGVGARMRVRGGGGARGEGLTSPPGGGPPPPPYTYTQPPNHPTITRPPHTHSRTHALTPPHPPPPSRRSETHINPAGATALAPSLAGLTGLATLNLACARLTLPRARSATLRERVRSSAGSHGRAQGGEAGGSEAKAHRLGGGD